MGFWGAFGALGFWRVEGLLEFGFGCFGAVLYFRSATCSSRVDKGPALKGPIRRFAGKMTSNGVRFVGYRRL